MVGSVSHLPPVGYVCADVSFDENFYSTLAFANSRCIKISGSQRNLQISLPARSLDGAGGRTGGSGHTSAVGGLSMTMIPPLLVLRSQVSTDYIQRPLAEPIYNRAIYARQNQ
jgi:hypothetical protein